MHRHGRVKVRLGGAHLHGDAQQLRHFARADDAGTKLAVLTRGALDAAGLAAYGARGDAPAWEVGRLHAGARAQNLVAGGAGAGRVLVTASEKTSLEVYRREGVRLQFGRCGAWAGAPLSARLPPL